MINWDTQLDKDVQETLKDKKPPKYQVILLNDDYTPMDFVVDVLCRFFNLKNDQATEIMLAVHYTGRGHCGVYTSEIAETKVKQVHTYASRHEHPLKCVMEKL